MMAAIAATAERPILFSGRMISAILANRKTQTRRMVNPQPPAVETVRTMAGDGYSWLPPGRDDNFWRVAGPVWAVRECWRKPNGYPPNVNDCVRLRCPYGKPGDRLWVRESFVTGWPVNDFGDLQQFDEDGGELPRQVWYRADSPDLRWLSDDGEDLTANPPWKPSIHMPRRLSRITLEILEIRIQPLHAISNLDALAEGFDPTFKLQSYVADFRDLWDQINGRRCPWNSNPWVWALTFKRVAGA